LQCRRFGRFSPTTKDSIKHGHQRNIELTFDKRMLASRLGMTPENLSRNLALLAKCGVKSSGRDIVIGDPSAFGKFAKPNALIGG
jgi:CRP/FNR family transcriptional regulator, transcriptional activator FtrB